MWNGSRSNEPNYNLHVSHLFSRDECNICHEHNCAMVGMDNWGNDFHTLWFKIQSAGADALVCNYVSVTL